MNKLSIPSIPVFCLLFFSGSSFWQSLIILAILNPGWRVAGNYPGHMKYAGTGWRCHACTLEVREDQEHLAGCEGYADVRVGKDLRSEAELVQFYKGVMARRKERGWD